MTLTCMESSELASPGNRAKQPHPEMALCVRERLIKTAVATPQDRAQSLQDKAELDIGPRSIMAALRPFSGPQ